MKKFLSLFLEITGFVALVSVAVLGVGLLLAGHWLPDNDLPRESDAIVVLGGGFARPFHAADLYRDGYAPVVYVSKPFRNEEVQLLDQLEVDYPREERVMAEVLRKRGVPGDAIMFFGESNISTYEEAQELAKLFGDQQKRLLVVTSSYHVRRTRDIFEDLLPECELTVSATPYETFHQRWWTDRDSAIHLVLECAKYVYYLTGGSFLSTEADQVDAHLPEASPDEHPDETTAPQGETHDQSGPAAEPEGTQPAAQPAD